MPQGRYYISRIVKLGLFTSEVLIETIKKANVLETRNFGWALTDIHESFVYKHKYVFGKLSKFKKDGEISIIDRTLKCEVKGRIDDLSTAMSPFVYFPDFSGIAYLHVWNQIQEETFRSRFQEIIDKTNDKLFSKCELKQITDYRTFSTRLNALDQINELSATVHPPNPLFGRFWKSLRNYIIDRNADSIKIKEFTEKENGLKTNIRKVFEAVSKNQIDFLEDQELPIVDSALLMAADGYGKGKIVGKENMKEVVIRTGDNQNSFLFNKEPEPHELAGEAFEMLKLISNERNMEH